MKKFVLLFVLVAMLAAGTAFADHPDGWGVGIVGGWGYGIGEAYGLSLKIPSIPVFWSVNLAAGSHYFRFGLTGDYYLIDSALSIPTLHWFLGVGGFFNFYSWSYKYNWDGGDYSYTSMNFGARVPIGVSWQPIPLVEVFLDVAPSLGAHFDGGHKYKKKNGDEVKEGAHFRFLFGLPIELGLRLWF